MPWLYYCVQCSLVNFVMYNVAGGGDSALYGVEPPSFYLRNAFNNFQLQLPLALAAPLLLMCCGSSIGQGPSRGRMGQTGDSGKATIDMLIALSPLYSWLLAITALPHKEERFLYVVYPLVSWLAVLVCQCL